MIPNKLKSINKNQGSSLSLPAPRWVGIRATFLSFCISVPPSKKTLLDFQEVRKKRKRFRKRNFARPLSAKGGIG